MTERDAILALIKELADKQGVPWEAIAAICTAESAFDPYAVRYEPGYKWLYGSTDKLSATERMQQMTSWGLMQVMGAVAREYGHQGWLSRLCIPAVGLHFGIVHLQRYQRRYQNWPDAIASYNAGRPIRQNDKYLNQPYVDKVLFHWSQFEQPIPLKESEV